MDSGKRVSSGPKRGAAKVAVQKAHRALRMGERKAEALARLKQVLAECADDISPTLREQITRDIEEEERKYKLD